MQNIVIMKDYLTLSRLMNAVVGCQIIENNCRNLYSLFDYTYKLN